MHDELAAGESSVDVEPLKAFLKWYSEIVEVGQYFYDSQRGKTSLEQDWGDVKSVTKEFVFSGIGIPLALPAGVLTGAYKAVRRGAKGVRSRLNGRSKKDVFNDLLKQAEGFKLEDIKNIVTDMKEDERKAIVAEDIVTDMKEDERKAIDAEEVLDQLKKAKSIFDLKNADGLTLIMLYLGNDNLVKKLVEAGANINAKNSKGETPLVVAAKEGNLKHVKFLVENNATDKDLALSSSTTERSNRVRKIEEAQNRKDNTTDSFEREMAADEIRIYNAEAKNYLKVIKFLCKQTGRNCPQKS